MRRPWTLRTRVTVLAALAAAGVVALLVVAFNVVLAASLDRDVNRTLRSKAAAATTTAVVTAGHVVVRDAPNDAAIDREVWVYEGRRALVRPPGAAALQRAADALARRPGTFAQTPDGEVRLHSAALTGAGRRLGSVVVAESLEVYDRTTDVALAGSVALGGLLLLLVAALTWIATGRALAPVREMTRTAADWSAHDRERRFGPGPRPDELGELAGTFDALLDRLAASLRHEQRLSAELSHELRTPLARIAAEAELLGRRARSAEELEAGLWSITVNAEEMAAILDTLMKAARAEAGLDRGRAQLESLLDRIATRWRPAFAARGIALEVATPAGLQVGVDAEVAERILTPLLQNAERHAVARVSLSAERSGTTVLIHLDDDGPGIPDELRDDVFEPGRTATNGDGAGLGLALARRLARATGGDVEAVGDAGATGAHLRVRLPA
jgi:two-component system heavy metal sensor histidine kinase CusS